MTFPREQLEHAPEKAEIFSALPRFELPAQPFFTERRPFTTQYDDGPFAGSYTPQFDPPPHADAPQPFELHAHIVETPHFVPTPPIDLSPPPRGTSYTMVLEPPMVAPAHAAPSHAAPLHVEPVHVEPSVAVAPAYDPSSLGGIFATEPEVARAIVEPAQWFADEPAALASPFVGVAPSEFAVPAPAPQAIAIEDFDRPVVQSLTDMPPPLATDAPTHVPAPATPFENIPPTAAMLPPIPHAAAKQPRAARAVPTFPRGLIIGMVVLAAPATFILVRIHDVIVFANLLGSAL